MRTNIAQHGCRAPADRRRRGGTGRDQGRQRSPEGRAEDAAAPNPDIPLVNEIDFGVRGHVVRRRLGRGALSSATAICGTAPRSTASASSRTPTRYRYTLQADNVGYRDQRFSASYMNYGKVKANFEWNQIPLFYSQTTRTLYDHVDARAR